VLIDTAEYQRMHDRLFVRLQKLLSVDLHIGVLLCNVILLLISALIETKLTSSITMSNMIKSRHMRFVTAAVHTKDDDLGPLELIPIERIAIKTFS